MSKISAGKDVSDTGASLKCLGHIRIIHNLIMKILSNYLETLIRQTTRAKNIFIHAERLTERIPFRYGNVIVWTYVYSYFISIGIMVKCKDTFGRTIIAYISRS